jgi:gas vesicle structural protein
MADESENLAKNISLCDALDRLLNKGVVITGDITISVAGVDLLYVGLRGLVCAIDAMGELPPSLAHHPRPRMAAEGMQ